MTNVAAAGLTLSTHATHSGEYLSGSWVEMYSDGGVLGSAAELGLYRVYSRGGDVFNRYSGDVDDTKLSLTKPRQFRCIGTGGTFMGGCYMVASFHQITYLITGSLSGYSGDGSGILVNVYRSGSNEYVTSSITAAGGAFTASVFDGYTPHYCTAYQDSTRLGRSANSLPARF
jgi:hypothetical protein